MRIAVSYRNKPLCVELSSRAAKALAKCEHSLLVRMELIFACMTHKKVHFEYRAVEAEGAVTVAPHLMVSFRPVLKKFCGLDDDNDPVFEPAEVANINAYHPSWLKVDIHKGQWSGQFGFERKAGC